MRLPIDIKAEVLINYLPQDKRQVEFRGSHKRNAYGDILSVSKEENETVVALSREGLYDIMPEALFHPIDRFENLPANEYKERFAEEYEAQQREEENARSYFKPFDDYIFNLSCEYERVKDRYFNDNSVIQAIICDKIQDRYTGNRFIRRILPFTARCSMLRGNIDLITLMLRRILKEEGILLNKREETALLKDEEPHYNTTIDEEIDLSDDHYLGNEYYESITKYTVYFWSERECNDKFLTFVDEISVLEDFINDYFMGIENKAVFKIETLAPPVRLSDTLYHNYLNYNTNL